MFEEIIFKQKLKYIFRNKRNKKKPSSLINHNKNSFLFNTKDSIDIKNIKKDDYSLIFRNPICKFQNTFIRNEINKTNKTTNSFFNLTTTKKQNMNINKILENEIKPYNMNNKNLNKTINLNIYKKKANLIVKNYFLEKEKVFPWKNPFKDYKEPLFIYEILKFKNEEKPKTIDNFKQNNNFEKYVKKINNNNSLSYARNKRIDLLLKKAEEEKINKNLKEIKKIEKRKLYDVELRDIVEIPSIQAQKIKTMVYKFITRETNIKDIMKNQRFYQNLENRINFIYDGLKLPTIKNNLIKNNIGPKHEWANINAIDTKTLIYLNQLRLIIQKKIDKKKQIKNLEKKETTLYIDDNIHFHYKQENQIDKLDKEFLYDCQKYISSKSLTYHNLNICNNILIKKCIFNKYKYIEKKNE